MHEHTMHFYATRALMLIQLPCTEYMTSAWTYACHRTDPMFIFESVCHFCLYQLKQPKFQLTEFTYKLINQYNFGCQFSVPKLPKKRIEFSVKTEWPGLVSTISYVYMLFLIYLIYIALTTAT
jgi:hypothetical protein